MEKKLKGRGILKIDVQYAEHLALAGAKRALAESVDVVVLELTLRPPLKTAKSLLELVSDMDEMGFVYFDDVGEWRNPQSGNLEQKDILFVRRSLADEIAPVSLEDVGDDATVTEPVEAPPVDRSEPIARTRSNSKGAKEQA